LRVTDRSDRDLIYTALSDLLEVELDTKTIQRVQENMSLDVLPQLRLAQGKVGAATDVSRIVLLTPTQAVPLTAERVSISYTTESFGEMRRFLRKHGWLPEAERAKALKLNELPGNAPD
jgi:hypothetical protein